MPAVPEKWNLAGIERETGINRRKLGEIIGKHNIEPCGENGKGFLYRMRPVVQAYAKAGAADAEVERARYFRAQAEKNEIDIGISKGELIHVDDVYDMLAPLCASIRETVLGSPIDRSEQNRLLKQLQKAVMAKPAPKGKRKRRAKEPQTEMALK